MLRHVRVVFDLRAAPIALPPSSPTSFSVQRRVSVREIGLGGDIRGRVMLMVKERR